MQTDGALFPNRYGSFREGGRRFVITDPRTPTPWVNVVCPGDAGFVVSQNGGGFSWLENSQLNVLTRWEMDLVLDRHGKFLYAADVDSGEVWSLAPAPTRADYDSYACTHACGFTRFETVRSGIGATWSMSIDAQAGLEVWAVELTNPSGRARRIRLSSFFEWCCGVAPDSKREFHRLFITTRFDADAGRILATKNMWDVPHTDERDHWNQAWPYTAGIGAYGFDPGTLRAFGDKREFLGAGADPARPDALLGAPRTGAFGRFGDACGALGGDIALAPGQSRRVHFVLGAHRAERTLVRHFEQLADPDRAHACAEASERDWTRDDGVARTLTRWPDLDLLCNYWLPYQAVSGRLRGRTGYYQQSGAYGFRDQLQDSQVWLTGRPAACLDQIRLHARHQFLDGSVYHWWHPLTESGLRTRCSDDYLWLPFLLAAYVRETGDIAGTQAPEPFVDSPAAAPLLEHAERSFGRAFSRLSPRGLPLIGSCDWNDGLSAMGVEGRGESAWLAMFLAHTLAEWAGLYSALGRPGDAAGARAKAASLLGAVDLHAWDGRHYRYGTRDDGRWIGASDCEEGRVHLNAQTWAILSGAGDAERRESAWSVVRQTLLTDYGPLLLAPAYTVPDATIGYITRYAPGTRENGGVYMHAATWALAAACEMGDVETVERIWASISPPRRCADADAYRAEPYVVPGNVDGPLSDLPGRAGWTWYTGSAQWLRTVVLERVLGVRAVWGGLAVQPCAPASLGRVEVVRPWRGCRVTVAFDAADCRPGTRPRLTCDGAEVETPALTPAHIRGKAEARVEASWDTGGAGLRGAPPAQRRTSV